LSGIIQTTGETDEFQVPKMVSAKFFRLCFAFNRN